MKLPDPTSDDDSSIASSLVLGLVGEFVELFVDVELLFGETVEADVVDPDGSADPVVLEEDVLAIK